MGDERNYLVGIILGFIVASTLYLAAILAQAEVTGPRIASAELADSRTLPIAAVSSSQQTGVIGHLEVRTAQGSGDILIRTNPFLQTDLQYSANIASSIAQASTGIPLQERDFVLSYEVPADVVGGGSAGAATAIAMMSLLTGQRVRDDAVLTGSIQPDGTIGPVGGILEKTKAAADSGYGVILVPSGQGTIRFYERIVEQRRLGPSTLYSADYIPHTVNLSEVGEELGIEVVEVENIEDAARIMLE